MVDAPRLSGAGAVTCCCVYGNTIYAFSDIGHIYRIEPNPFKIATLLTPSGDAGGGEANVGPWYEFPVDPGWTNVTLRYRRTLVGLQIEGFASGPLSANSLARLGVLPEGFRPARQQYVPIVCGDLQLNSGPGLVRVDPDGAVSTRWSIAQGSMAISAIIALD